MPAPNSNRRILILQGHPDPHGGHFGHALSEAYRRGAVAAGHEVRVLEVARMPFPLLESKAAWESDVPDAIAHAQADLAWAEHVLIFFPLWLGSMPAVLKGFLEQVLRPGFAVPPLAPHRSWRPPLRGKSSRVVVTMGMPAPVYRLFYGAHSLRCLQRNILAFCGLGPNRSTLVGSVESRDPDHRLRWIERMRRLGIEAG